MPIYSVKSREREQEPARYWIEQALRGFWQPGYHNVRKRLRPFSFASPALAGFAHNFIYLTIVMSPFSNRFYVSEKAPLE